MEFQIGDKVRFINRNINQDQVMIVTFINPSNDNNNSTVIIFQRSDSTSDSAKAEELELMPNEEGSFFDIATGI